MDEEHVWVVRLPDRSDYDRYVHLRKYVQIPQLQDHLPVQSSW